MHIVALVAGVLIAVIGVLWRLGIIFRTGKEIADTAVDVHAAVRRHRFRHAATPRPPIEQIDDPMLAATTIMVLVHRAEREITPADRNGMAATIRDAFRIDDEAAQSLVSEAIHAAGSVQDDLRWTRRLARVLTDRCTLDERHQVIAMITNTADDRRLTERQQPLLATYRDAAGLR